MSSKGNTRNKGEAVKSRVKMKSQNNPAAVAKGERRKQIQQHQCESKERNKITNPGALE
jgi:hypothetical protein